MQTLMALQKKSIYCVVSSQGTARSLVPRLPLRTVAPGRRAIGISAPLICVSVLLLGHLGENFEFLQVHQTLSVVSYSFILVLLSMIGRLIVTRRLRLMEVGR